MNILEDGGLKSLNPFTSTPSCSSISSFHCAPTHHTSECAVSAESTSVIHILQGHSGALAINVGISAFYPLLAYAREPCDLILQRQGRAPCKQARADRGRGQKKPSARVEVEVGGAGEWNTGNKAMSKKGKHQKFNALFHPTFISVEQMDHVFSKASLAVYHNNASTQPSLL